jgi:hypothetical protein
MRTQRFLCGASFAVAATTMPPSRQRQVSDRSGRVQQTRLSGGASVMLLYALGRIAPWAALKHGHH